MSIIDDTVKTLLNEKVKPTIKPNQVKITAHDKINSELPNENITLIPLTSPSVPSQVINYLSNASTTLILPTSPTAPSQEIDYLTNGSTTLIPPSTSPSAPSQEIHYLTMPPSKLAKERPNQNIAASNQNPVFKNNLEILSNSTQKLKQNTKQNNQVPIKLFYRNQMTSYYKIEETQLQQIIHNNIKVHSRCSCQTPYLL